MTVNFGHQTPTGVVLLWTGEKFQELKMLKKSEVEEFLNSHKKLSETRKKALLEVIGVSNEKKDNSKKLPQSNLPKWMKDSSRKSISLSRIQGYEEISIGTVVHVQGKYYRRGKTLWIPVKN